MQFNSNMEQTSLHRDYSTISPSARWLLQLKGLTKIPFAREAAELMLYAEKYEPDFTSKDLALWGRVMHFESRYWSIDQLLSDIPARNILELSSGFSFRGLEAIKQNGVYYIDTDLDEVIAAKRELTAALQHDQPGTGSKLDILPLNALDEEKFKAAVSRFNEGEVVIVNEGLLVYLDTPEKERLCKIIRDVLRERGGYWITADIYIKRDLDAIIKIDDKLSEFFAQHNIEQNKFDSFEDAENFFNKAGFVIDKEAEPDYAKLTALPYFMQSATPGQMEKMRGVGKIHATWRLKLQDTQAL